jgi:hypothetical protein
VAKEFYDLWVGSGGGFSEERAALLASLKLLQWTSRHDQVETASNAGLTAELFKRRCIVERLMVRDTRHCVSRGVNFHLIV